MSKDQESNNKNQNGGEKGFSARYLPCIVYPSYVPPPCMGAPVIGGEGCGGGGCGGSAGGGGGLVKALGASPSIGGDYKQVNLADGSRTGSFGTATSNSPSPAGGMSLKYYHMRQLANGNSADVKMGLGNNVFSSDFAHIQDLGSDQFLVHFTPGRDGKSFRFEKQPDGSFIPLHGAQAELVETATDYILKELDGTLSYFNVTNGWIYKQVAPDNRESVWSFDSDAKVKEVRKSWTEAGQNVILSRFYEYYPTPSGGGGPGGPGGPGSLKQTGGGETTDVQFITERSYVGALTEPASGDWDNKERVELVIADQLVAERAEVGNLTRIVHQTPDGSGGWTDQKTRMFTYYTSNSGPGFDGGMKHEITPQGFESLVNPDTATEAQLLAASSNYFEYDSQRRISLIKTKGGAESSTITYSANPNTPTGVNEWVSKSVMTNNDGSSRTVYFNPDKSDLFVADSGDGQEHYRFNKFLEATRCPEETSYPSSINGSGIVFDESQDDLDIQFNTNSGRVDKFVYDGDSSRVTDVATKNGSAGTAELLSSTEYISRTVGSGDEERTAYFPSKEISYRSTLGNGDPVETTLSYTWHTDSLQPATITTNLPDIATANNGVAFPQNDQTVAEFDEFGKLIKQTDAIGTVTEFEYDLATASTIKTTRDTGSGNLNIVDESDVNIRGRVIKTIGPVHNVDGNDVRKLSWQVKVGPNETWSAVGYLDVSSGNETLVNPVSIEQKSSDGTIVDRITATRGSTVESAGALTSSDNFPQSSWTAWSRQTYDLFGHMLTSRVYHAIPATGDGVAGTNFVESSYASDEMGRQNKSVAADGTINRTVFNGRGLPVSTWIGTDDTGATDADPTGGGTSGNNMVMLSEVEYDNGLGGGDGLRTKTTQKVNSNSNDDRVTEFENDWRGRLIDTITTDGVNEFHQQPTLDNLGRATMNQTFRNDAGTMVLIAKSKTDFDERGRQFRSLTFSVSDAGSTSKALVSYQWYDANGRTIKSTSPGSTAFSKMEYDAIGRTTVSYSAYFDGSGTDDPTSVAANMVLTESNTQYNDAGQVVLSTSKDRLHDSTGAGSLNGPSGSGSHPKSRDSYSAMWYDEIGRSVASANYGTNGGTIPTRPDSAPASSDTILVSQSVYDISGRAFESIDPAGSVTRTEVDDAGRTTKTIRNFGGSVTETVRTEFNSLGQMSKQIAENVDTGDQETVYSYGVSLADSDLASGAMLRQLTHPDSGTVVYAYDRAGQQTSMTDPNGSVHQYDYDAAGRRVADTVSTLGSGVDGGVRRIEHAFDDRMRLEKVTSLDATTGGSIESEIQYQYNEFGQLIKEYQQHGAAVDVSSSPVVEYDFEDGSANTIRAKSIVYPDGRQLDYQYGTVGSEADLLDRVETIEDGAMTLVTYQRSGGGSLVSQTYNEPGIEKTIALGSGTDPYSALDRFGRMIDLRWTKGSTDLVRTEYDYDRVSNRLFERNLIAGRKGSNPRVDSLFGFDALNRMTSFKTGVLDSAGTGMSILRFSQSFGLDETGNIEQFDVTTRPYLMQTRTHNSVNEITDIAETAGDAWATPAHDDAGNMTAIPQPNDLTSAYDATWDAWNRLVKLEDSSLTVAEYQYDGNNRRIAKLIYTAGSLDETRHVYYSAQSQALEERIDAATSPEIQFVWNLGYVDDLLMRDRDVNRNGTMNHRAYALTDLRYSMAALSNASGAVIERFAYDAHGQAKAFASNFVSRPSSNYDWEFRYTGRRQDLETGLMFFRARYYSTELGRFISRDPLGFVDGMSLYRGYFLPNSVDPLGLGENTWECQKTRFHARYCIGRFTEQIVDVWVEFCKCEKCDGTIRWILNNVDDQGSKTQKNLRCILDYIILTKVPHPRVPGSFNTYHGHDFLDGDGDTEVTHWVAFDDCSTTPDGSDIDEFPEVEDPQW